MKNNGLKSFLLILLTMSLFSLVFLSMINLDHDSGSHEICPGTSEPQNCSKLGSSSFDMDLYLGLLAQYFSKNFKTGLFAALLLCFFISFFKSYFAAGRRLTRLRLFSKNRLKNSDFLIKLIDWLSILRAKTQELS